MLNMNTPLTDVSSNIPNMCGSMSALSDFLQAQNVGSNPTLINPSSTVPPSSPCYTIPAYHTPSITCNLVSSSSSGMIGNDLHLPAINSNVQINPTFTLPTLGSSSLQMADVKGGDNLRLQTISTDMQSMGDIGLRRNQLLLSLLHERQMSNSN